MYKSWYRTGSRASDERVNRPEDLDLEERARVLERRIDEFEARVRSDGWYLKRETQPLEQEEERQCRGMRRL